MRLLTRLLARTLSSPALSSPSQSSHRRHAVLVSRSLHSQPFIRRPESARLGVLASPWSTSQLRRFRIRGADVSSPDSHAPIFTIMSQLLSKVMAPVLYCMKMQLTCLLENFDVTFMLALVLDSRLFKSMSDGVRPGNVIQRKGKTYQVVKSQHTTQGRGGAAIQIPMNSLYGRFGINPKWTVTEICNLDLYNHLTTESDFIYADKLRVSTHSYIVSYLGKTALVADSDGRPPRISAVQLAAAITIVPEDKSSEEAD
ncbi:hypothetical protein RJ640_002589 [Escallonia rubra]|uniref:Translation elongation factor KOW-like domain-containing protein n=1 Tax=Escallonia rubra TaxID=112253 RepID=A0AA88RNZ0_9ASTE|nr:hypothetical protein RJ640_002589 [Escallonia rubra]